MDEIKRVNKNNIENLAYKRIRFGYFEIIHPQTVRNIMSNDRKKSVSLYYFGWLEDLWLPNCLPFPEKMFIFADLDWVCAAAADEGTTCRWRECRVWSVMCGLSSRNIRFDYCLHCLQLVHPFSDALQRHIGGAWCLHDSVHVGDRPA